MSWSVTKEIEVYLHSLGWSGCGFAGIVSRHGDYRVNLEGDSGYVWQLERFDDSDFEGVATPRWLNMDIEGDTLEELQAAVGSMGGRS